MLIGTSVSKKHKNIKRKKSRRSPVKKSIIIESKPVILIETGILIVSADDPISSLFSYITRQDYSLVGIYRKYEDTEDIYIELIHIFDGEEPYWLMNTKYLYQLKEYLCIKKILMYKYIGPEDIHLEQPYDTPIEDLLISLFGYHIRYLPGIQRISSIIKTQHIYDEDPVKSFLDNSDMLSRNDLTTIINEGELRKSFKRDRYYMGKIITTFTDMITHDDSFMDLVAKKYVTNVYPYDIMYKTLIDHTHIQKQTVKLLEDWIQTGSIPLDDLTNLIESIPNIHSFDSDIKLPNLEIPKHLIVIDKRPASSIVDSVTDLKLQINSIVETIERDEIPYIQLNGLINRVNDLVEYYGIGDSIPTINKPSSGLISISPNGNNSIPLILKSGNRITLTTRNFNLTMFTRDELIEILEVIDAMTTIETNQKYEYLRTKITEEITKR